MKQFSIRDLLFVFVIFALVLGWWFDRHAMIGRFQIHSDPQSTYVLDTATGKVWHNHQSDLYPDKVSK